MNESKTRGKHFTVYDRNEIARLRKAGKSCRKIAERLDKSFSAVAYEIRKNSRSPNTRYGEPDIYDSKIAHQKAYVRRKYAKHQGMKIVRHPALRRFIDDALLRFQTPAAIAGRLKAGLEQDAHGHTLPHVSRSAIEKYLGSPYAVEIKFELDKFKRQFRRRKKRPKTERLSERTFIDERPEIVARRERIGDVELDFVVSGKNGTGYLLTAIDRKSRKSFIRKLLPVSVGRLKQLLLEIKQEFPALASITTDNDILLAGHNSLSEMLGVPIYFCHPYSSWEKGSIENLNKYIRKFIKRGSDISSYKKSLIKRIEDLANGRFMEVLGFLTPNEVLTRETAAVAVGCAS